MKSAGRQTSPAGQLSPRSVPTRFDASKIILDFAFHDFNPGVAQSGLFWTAPIDRGSVKVNLGSGSAAVHVADLEVEDYGNVANALVDGPSVDAAVSFDINWSGVDARVKLRNTSTDFAGEFIRNSATLSWSAAESGFGFTSDPLESHFAEIGHERNGLFFR